MSGARARLRPWPPDVVVGERVWPADALAWAASRYHEEVQDGLGASPSPVATVLTNHPDAVALFFALSALSRPVMLLPAEPGAWPRAVPHADPIPVFLAPSARHLADAAPGGAWHITTLAEPDLRARPGPAVPPFLSAPGVVLFTSGSTGAAKPVYRRLHCVLAGVQARLDALGVPPGGNVLASLPLERAFGLTNGLIAATLLGGRLGLLERFTPPAWIELAAGARYDYWADSVMVADLVTRTAPGRRVDGPTACIMMGRPPEPVSTAFRHRFGVPLRGHYGSTESGIVSADNAPAPLVRPATEGRVHPGVTVRIGETPDAPVPPGTPGRIWVASPWLFEGYGWPPAVEPAPLRDGWWGTPDLGTLDEEDVLTLAGRVDDRVKLGSGRMIDLGEVSTALGRHPGVRDAVAVALEHAAGVVVGVLVEGDRSVTPGELRAHLALSLPAWAQPRVLEVTAELPRLPNGKPDRLATRAALSRLVR